MIMNHENILSMSMCQLETPALSKRHRIATSVVMLAIATPLLNAYQSDTASRMKKFCVLSLLQSSFCFLYDTLQFRTSKEVPVKAHIRLFLLLIDNAIHALSACLGWTIVLHLHTAKFHSPLTAINW